MWRKRRFFIQFHWICVDSLWYVIQEQEDFFYIMKHVDACFAHLIQVRTCFEFVQK